MCHDVFWLKHIESLSPCVQNRQKNDFNGQTIRLATQSLEACKLIGGDKGIHFIHSFNISLTSSICLTSGGIPQSVIVNLGTMILFILFPSARSILLGCFQKCLFLYSMFLEHLEKKGGISCGFSPTFSHVFPIWRPKLTWVSPHHGPSQHIPAAADAFQVQRSQVFEEGTWAFRRRARYKDSNGEIVI